MSDFSYPLVPAQSEVSVLKAHPMSHLFPRMPYDEFLALVEDIKVHGQREPILVHGGLILDGRHRASAVEQLQKAGAKIELRTREYDGPTDEATLQALVISANLARRHLTQSQRAAIALYVLPAYEARAKERLKTNRRAPPAGFPKDPDLRRKTEEGIEAREEGDARQLAAIDLGVSARYVSDMKRVKREAPDLVEKVRQGELTVPEALRQLASEQKTPSPKAVLSDARVWDQVVHAAEALVAGLLELKDREFKVTEGLKHAREVAGLIRRAKPRETR
jgi:hypothetical protein